MLKSEQMNACATNTCLNVGTWIRKKNTFVNEVTGGTAADFIRLWKEGDREVYRIIEENIVKPVLAEKRVRQGIRDGRFKGEEVFSILVDLMLVKNKITKLRTPDRLVSFLQCSLRNQLNHVCGIKKKKVDQGTILECDFNMRNVQDEQEGNQFEQIPDSIRKVAMYNGRLDEDERNAVANSFSEYWRQDPRTASICAMRNAGYPIPLIKNLLGLQMSENAVSQICTRGKQKMAKFMSKHLGMARCKEMIG